MTALSDASPRTRAVRPATTQTAHPARLNREYRKRDVGVGYGNSSGYASDRHYARSWGQPRFRCY